MDRTTLFRRLAVLAVSALAIPLARAYPGLLDTAFGSSGLQSTQIAAAAYVNSSTRATAVARQPDGKLVVAGPTSTDFFGLIASGLSVARSCPTAAWMPPSGYWGA